MNESQDIQPESTQLSPDASSYPASVKAAYGAKAPVLTVKGNSLLLDAPGLGFCGSRKASEKGLAAAVDCADQAAQAGFVIISGNAAGVDTTAHHAALAAGGSTILVLPEGMDQFRIRRELCPVWDWNRVLVISQFEPEAIWRGYRAMTRNDLIIALSRAMIVIEAGDKGGTLAAGMNTLKKEKPLFVANYEAIEEQAPGNAQLLGLGAYRLSRSRKTGRANIAKLAEVAARPVPDRPNDHQMNLL